MSRSAGERLLDGPGERARSQREAGEELGRGGHSEVPHRDLGEQISEVSGHFKVASFEELLARDPGPAAVNFPAFYGTAEDQHDGRVAVIGPAVAVLLNGRTPTW